MVGGEKGKFIRVKVEIPLDKPIKRSGFVTLGSGTKYWVDYKYERLCRFCHYCSSLIHEQFECDVKTADEKGGTVKEGKFGSWLKAGGGGGGGARSFSDPRGGGSFRQTVSPANGQASKGKFKMDVEKESARFVGKMSNSRLIDIDDNERISLNGKELRIGDLLSMRDNLPSDVGQGDNGPVDSEPSLIPDSGKAIGPGVIFKQQDPVACGLQASVETTQVGQKGTSSITLSK